MKLSDSVLVEVRKNHIEHNIPFYEIIAFMLLATNADPNHLSVGKRRIYQDGLKHLDPVHNRLADLHIGICGIRYSIAKQLGFTGRPFDLLKPRFNIRAFCLYYGEISREAGPIEKIEHLDNAIPLHGITVDMYLKKLKAVLSMPLI